MRGEEVKINQSLHHGSGSRDRRKERMSQSLGKIEIPPTEPRNEHSIQHRSIPPSSTHSNERKVEVPPSSTHSNI